MTAPKWYSETARQHFEVLYAGGKFMSSRAFAALTGRSKSTGSVFMAFFRENWERFVPEAPVVALSAVGMEEAPEETLSEAEEGRTWVDERSGTVFTDLGSDYGVIIMTQGEFRSFRRDYSKLWGGKAQSQIDLAYKYRLPSAHAVALFTRIHGIRQSSIPFTDSELEAEGVDALVGKTIESTRQAYMLKLQEKSREQEKRDAEKWNAFEMNARLIASEVRAIAARPVRPPRSSMVTRDHFAVFISMADLHYGKLDVDRFGNVVYDRQEAERVARAALDDLIAQALMLGMPDEIILLAGGSDFLHADGPKLLTSSMQTAQGPQSDGTYRQMLTGGAALMIDLVKTCRTVAPVRLIDVPGNHDAQSSLFISLLLEQAFAGDPDVIMVRGDGGRVLSAYGDNSLYFLHGDTLKRDVDLFRLMQADADELGSHLRPFRLAFGGHTHGERAVDLGGIKYHVCSALSGSDDWHREQGWKGSTREAQAFIIRSAGGKGAVFYSSPEALKRPA